ncbi:hypothetical protein [Paracraurococcus lichenis]|uniref:Uncharacterized protein n=1 Tax=Paracraurococcus lichenis TaxID=3064888 RepID=A0ABT9E2E2_9PROT|nr:hypothetical protein [Paracraurococcus sp. LOR1-02]MDO9710332.1 hypothetical protein [Paracraurococcus sp. LOR1-02]
MSTDPVMRPDQSKNPGEDYENTVSSGAGAKARPRDKRPEAQYPQHDREQGVNRTDAAAPSGPVNIGVKQDKPDDSGPQAAGQTDDKATGRGSADTPSLPRE